MLNEMKQKARNFLSSYFGSFNADEPEEGYLEGKEKSEEGTEKFLIKPVILVEDTDIEGILNSLRQGNFIAILDVKFMKKMDPDYLKKVIGKIKKTTQAINGDIAGIGDNFIVITPPSVKIYRSEKNKNRKN